MLDETTCSKYVDWSLRRYPDVKVRPKVLCVGHIVPLKVAVYEKKGDDFNRLTDENAAKIIKEFHYASSGIQTETSYIASPGTCQGDSGGPLYKKDDSGYVVTGELWDYFTFCFLYSRLLQRRGKWWTRNLGTLWRN